VSKWNEERMRVNEEHVHNFSDIVVSLVRGWLVRCSSLEERTEQADCFPCEDILGGCVRRQKRFR